jgi:hypothetical protein
LRAAALASSVRSAASAYVFDNDLRLEREHLGIAEEREASVLCATISFSRKIRRNRRESTRTGRKEPGRQDTHRDPSNAMPDMLG